MAADSVARLEIEILTGQVQEAERRLRELERGAGRTERSTDNVGKSFKKLGLIATVATGLLAGGLVSAAKEAKEFEYSMSSLSAITGIVGDDFEYLTQRAKEFGITTTLSAGQSAKAMQLVASAKPDLMANAKALGDVTYQTIRLSEASGQDLKTATNAVVNSLNQYGEASNQAARFVNVLAAGTRVGSAEIWEMASSLEKVGGVAALTGQTFEETNSLLQIMAINGEKAELAGTHLKGLLLRLATQQENQFNPIMVGTAKALENIRDAALSAAEKKDLFGVISFKTGETLLKNIEKFKESTKAITDTTTAIEQQGIKLNTLDGDVKSFESALEGLKIEIGQKLIPTLRDGTQWATNFIRALTQDVAPKLQNQIQILAQYQNQLNQIMSISPDATVMEEMLQVQQQINKLRNADIEKSLKQQEKAVLESTTARINAEKELKDFDSKAYQDKAERAKAQADLEIKLIKAQEAEKKQILENSAKKEAQLIEDKITKIGKRQDEIAKKTVVDTGFFASARRRIAAFTGTLTNELKEQQSLRKEALQNEQKLLELQRKKKDIAAEFGEAFKKEGELARERSIAARQVAANFEMQKQQEIAAAELTRDLMTERERIDSDYAAEKSRIENLNLIDTEKRNDLLARLTKNRNEQIESLNEEHIGAVSSQAKRMSAVSLTMEGGELVIQKNLVFSEEEKGERLLDLKNQLATEEQLIQEQASERLAILNAIVPQTASLYQQLGDRIIEIRDDAIEELEKRNRAEVDNIARMLKTEKQLLLEGQQERIDILTQNKHIEESEREGLLIALEDYHAEELASYEQQNQDRLASLTNGLTSVEQAELDSYERRKFALEQFKADTEEQELRRTEALKHLTIQHNQNVLENEAKKYTMIMSASRGGMEQITSALKEGLGEQSMAYRASFAITKGLAVAESSVLAGLAIAKAIALSNTFEKAAAIAEAISATGAVISQIASVTFAGAYDKGGYIPAGQVGLVGERGAEFIQAGRQGLTVTGRRDTAQIMNNAQLNTGTGQLEISFKGGDDGSIDRQLVKGYFHSLLKEYFATDEGKNAVMSLVRSESM